MKSSNLSLLISKTKLALSVWTILILVIFLYEARDHWEDAEANALIAARCLIEKDITYRTWNASHGGVYVPVTEKTQPNPYLAGVDERDVETRSGRKLTLINPAYMTRQVHELESATRGTRSHITSLKLLRPQNRPDDWEARALAAFARGASEVASVEIMDGKKYMRAMQPLKVDRACLKCHAVQGYAEGDLRGGISASIPMQPFYYGIYRSTFTEGILYLIYWTVGAGLILSRARGEEKKNVALRMSEERHRLMYNNTPAMLHSTDRDGRLVGVSDYWLEVMGYGRDEVLGRSFTEFLTSASRRHAMEVALPEFARSGTCRDVEYQCVRKSGEVIETLLSATSERDPGGQVTRVFAVLQDITKRKRAEEALRVSEEKYRSMTGEFNALLDAIPDSITLISPDYRILWANRTAGERVGRDPQSLEGRCCYDLWFGRTEPCEECPVRESARSGATCEKQVTRNGRKFEVRAVPVMGKDGVVNVIRVGRDVTEHQLLEDQLRHAQKIESIGTLAGGIAHDFNNILSAIIGYGQIALMRMAPDDPVRPNIQHMLTSADKAAYLTQGLLAFGRKQMSSKKQFDLNELLGKTGTFLRRFISEDIEFRTNLHESPLVVLGDPNQIEQILMNLATNARDAMPDGGSFTITARAVRLDDEFTKRHGYGKAGSYGLITVADSGSGMDEETCKRIFEPFFTTKEVGKGTGLGLSIIYGIIKQHDGYINVYSEPGGGTTFRIYLPLIDPAGAGAVQAEETGYPARGTETILLAEDDEILRQLATSVLEEFGYEVIVAVDGEDALSKFADNKDRIQLLFSDLVMPRRSGKEVHDEILRIRPGMKTLFASGYSPDIVRDKVSLGKDTAIIYKPISPMDLLRQVRNLLDGGGASSS